MFLIVFPMNYSIEKTTKQNRNIFVSNSFIFFILCMMKVMGCFQIYSVFYYFSTFFFQIVKKFQIRLLRFFFDFHGLVLSPITLSLRLFDGWVVVAPTPLTRSLRGSSWSWPSSATRTWSIWPPARVPIRPRRFRNQCL